MLMYTTTSAQTIAENWTQTDCDGIEHDLFTTLDTGSAVIMEFVMLESCMPCINAAHLMEPIIDRYDMLYDNRVQYYTFGYNDSYACADFDTWESTNAISNDAALLLGADIGSYYGGMGMPTIVVVGRNTHTVYFNQFGFVVGDTTAFSAALSYALGVTDPETTIAEQTISSITISPMPVGETLHVVGNALLHGEAHIYDMQGKMVCVSNIDGQGNMSVNELTSGMYFIQIQTDTGISRASFIKN
jgi:hypothetical protein